MNTRSRLLLDKLKYQPLKKAEMEELESLAQLDESVATELEFIKLVEAAVIHKSHTDLRQKMKDLEAGYRATASSIEAGYSGNQTASKPYRTLRIAAVVTGILLLSGSIVLVLRQNDDVEQLSQGDTQESSPRPELKSNEAPSTTAPPMDLNVAGNKPILKENTAKQLADFEELLLMGPLELEDVGFGFAKNDFTNIRGFKILKSLDEQNINYSILNDTIVFALPEAIIPSRMEPLKLIQLETTANWVAGTYLFIGNKGYLLTSNGTMKAVQVDLKDVE
jgi:hypothetical protein